MCKKESHDEHLAAVKNWFSTSKVCSGSDLNMQADHRVDLDQEGILQFVDITTKNAGMGKFCLLILNERSEKRIRVLIC